MEYKSPNDYVSVNDFYKVTGYTCIYQANTELVMEISPEELTMSFVSSHYPRELIRHLVQRYGVTISQEYLGIYYIDGFLFPLQIIIADRLPVEEYLWLSRLRENLKVNEDIEPLALAYRGKDKNPLYAAAMDLIIRANPEQYEESRNMCEALRELFKDELMEWESRGLAKGRGIGLTEGRGLGLAEGILELLAEAGTVPDALRETILSQKNTAQLSAWLKLAAKTTSIAEFTAQIKSS